MHRHLHRVHLGFRCRGARHRGVYLGIGVSHGRADHFVSRGLGIAHHLVRLGHRRAHLGLRVVHGGADHLVCVVHGLVDCGGCVLGIGRRQGDAANAGHLQLSVARVLQRTRVADAAHFDVGNGEGIGRYEGDRGLRQSDGIGDQLAARPEYAEHGGGGAALVLDQRRIGLPAVHDRRDVDRIGTGERRLRAVEVRQGGVEIGERNHHLRCLMHGHLHRLEFVPRCLGVRHGGIGRGLGVAHHLLGVSHCRAHHLLGIGLGSAYHLSCLGLGRRDCGGGHLRLSRRERDAADAGHLQLSVAGVLQRARVPVVANRHVGYCEGVRRPEGDFGLRQTDGIGNQLAVRSEHLLHGGGGAALVPEQCRVGPASVHDIGDVDCVGPGE